MVGEGLASRRLRFSLLALLQRHRNGPPEHALLILRALAPLPRGLLLLPSGGLVEGRRRRC